VDRIKISQQSANKWIFTSMINDKTYVNFNQLAKTREVKYRKAFVTSCESASYKKEG